jgi:hypothetical protein
MHTWGVRAGLAVGLLVACSSEALAQGAPPADTAIDLQLFEPAAGSVSFITVADTTLAAPGQLALGMMLTFLSNPLTIYNVDADDALEGDRTNVVSSIAAGELHGSYGLTRELQLQAALPVVFAMSGEGFDPATARPAMDGLAVTGLGDLRIGVKTRLFRINQVNGIEFAADGGISLPSSVGSGGSSFLGDDLPAARARGIAQWYHPSGKLSVGANLGTILRKPRTLYASEVGPQLTWGAGATYRFTDQVAGIVEGFGRTGFTGIDSSPMELGGALRVSATKAIQVMVGGGAGMIRGIGSPDFRFFASVGYAPDTRDTDGDKIPNNRDRCPLICEDFDDFEDRDGCPDDDNDGDMRSDREDQCPSEAEDLDGFADEDGCPDPDNDGDGIADFQDRFCPIDKEDGLAPQPADGCPADKRDTDFDGIFDTADACFDGEEDFDGFEDWDGCPDRDQDKDQVADEEDRCPVCPEDLDGFDDGDGCPEADNDRDGFADADDKCPAEAEVVNSVDDWDGCPDEGGAELAVLEEDRLRFAAPVTFDRGALTRAGTALLEQAALVIRMHPEVVTWTLVVAAPKAPDARKQGELVLRLLAARGVEVSSLRLLTSAGAPAVALLVDERAEVEADALPACPAGLEVTPRPAPGAAPATPATPVESEPEVELE